MPGRKFLSGEEYRFGFNGKEDDRDWGTQNIQDYGFRLYNPSIGKFLSVDPLSPDYPWYTPYQFAGNKPINSSDLDGLEEKLEIYVKNNQGAHFELKSSFEINDELGYGCGTLEVYITKDFLKKGKSVDHEVDPITGSVTTTTQYWAIYKITESSYLNDKDGNVIVPLDTKVSSEVERYTKVEKGGYSKEIIGDAVIDQAVGKFLGRLAKAGSKLSNGKKSVADVLKTKTKTTSNKAVDKQIQKGKKKIVINYRYNNGSYENALQDFKSLDIIEGSTKPIQNNVGGGFTAKLKDGRTATVRPSSTRNKEPTLDINGKGADGLERQIKVRYN